MPSLDLETLAKTDPIVVRPGVDHSTIRYSDLNYSGRIKALLAATRDNGKPLDCDTFNDLLNGRRSLAYVQEYVSKA